MRVGRGFLLRYAVAVGVTVISTLLILCLKPFLSRGTMMIYIPAVVTSTWYGGLGPGLVTTLLGVVGTDFFFLQPTGSFVIQSADDIAELGVFAFVAVLTSVLNTAQQRAQRELLKQQKEVRLVFDVTRAANEAETVNHAFRFALRRLCEEGPWFTARVYLPVRSPPDTWLPSGLVHFRDDARVQALRTAMQDRPIRKGEGPAGRALDSGRAEWGGGLPGMQEVRTSIAFPVRVGMETFAVFECLSFEGVERNETLNHLMEVVGLELGRVVERQTLRERYSEAAWEQQRDFAQELHDGLGQELTGLGFLSKSLTDRLTQPAEVESAARLTDGLKRALEQIRNLMRGVSPVAPVPEGLMSALTQLAETTSSTCGLECRFDYPGPVLVEKNHVAVHLYRIAQEGVTNAVRHGRPSRIIILLKPTDEGLSLSVTDNGSGFPRKGREGDGSGLRIMRYRAGAIGGTFRAENLPEGGARLTCILAGIETRGETKEEGR